MYVPMYLCTYCSSTLICSVIVGSCPMYGVATGTLFVVARIRAQQVDAWRNCTQRLQACVTHICVCHKRIVICVAWFE